VRNVKRSRSRNPVVLFYGIPATGQRKKSAGSESEDTTMRTYTVQLFYSGCCTREVRTKNEEEAIKKARLQLNIDTDTKAQAEILNSLEPWEDADQVLG
jgi:hypothetical protein